MSEEIIINPSEPVLTNLNKLDDESLLKEFSYIKLEYTPAHIKHNMYINDPWASLVYFDLILSKNKPSLKSPYPDYIAIPAKRITHIESIACEKSPQAVFAETTVKVQKNILNFYRGFYYLTLYNSNCKSIFNKEYTIYKFEFFTKSNTDICISMSYKDDFDDSFKDFFINMFFNSIDKNELTFYFPKNFVEDLKKYDIL